MSITTVGASPYPATPPAWPSPSAEGQANKPDAQSFGASSGAASRDASADGDRLPPPQAATARGTGQRVNIIA